MAPVLLVNVDVHMQVLEQEIFGPILPIVTYQQFDTVIAEINQRPRPLAIYYFGEDKQEQRRLLDGTCSGSLAINEVLLQAGIERLPFGGVGSSGMGQYHGKEGFDSFSKIKPVLKQSRFSSFSMLYPPYGKRFQTILKYFVGL